MNTIYTTEGGDLVIEFDYEPYEAATDVAPETPENVFVMSVMAGPFEIIDWCSASAMRFFEEKCLESVKNETY